MRRRTMLHAIAVATLSAGCTDSPAAHSAESDCANCTSSPTVSRSADDCTVPESSPLPSADVPSDLTRESAESFALSVEKTYAVQRAEADGWNVDGTDWTESSVRAIDGGFLVEATVNLDAHKSTRAGTETEMLYGSLSYSGRYRVVQGRAERAPGEGGDTPPERGWTTLACS